MPIDNLTPDDFAKVILEGGGISQIPPAKSYIVTFNRGTKVQVTELADMGDWFYAGLGEPGRYPATVGGHTTVNARKAGFLLGWDKSSRVPNPNYGSRGPRTQIKRYIRKYDQILTFNKENIVSIQPIR